MENVIEKKSDLYVNNDITRKNYVGHDKLMRSQQTVPNNIMTTLDEGRYCMTKKDRIGYSLYKKGSEFLSTQYNVADSLNILPEVCLMIFFVYRRT